LFFPILFTFVRERFLNGLIRYSIIMKKFLIVLFLISSVGVFAQKKEGTVYMVSNAHFDTQWNWTVQTSISEYLRNTINQNIWLFENYPNYVFNFEGGIKYSWMKEYYPVEYAKIKEYIKQGRWHISGSSWDATDPNIPSPESFFRNILLGQQYYKDEFGVKSTDIFLPDCFGFGYTLPTIAAHCGLIGFSTQKLKWRTNPFYGDAKVPFSIGIWQGIDGSRIAAALDGRNYTQKYDEDLSMNKEIIDLVAKAPNNKAFRYYGVGDVGGSPTILSVESVERGIKGAGPVNLVYATSDQLFKEYLPFDIHPELPVYNGELLMDVHATGCYTSQSAMKLYNRRNEQLADAAERASVIAEWMGGVEYPSAKINQAWKRFIWHQFHDDLTGTSIPKAYTFSWNDELICQSQFNDILTYASATVSRNLDTRVKGVPVVVFNSLSHSRKDMVHAVVPFATQPKGVQVYSPKGAKVNAQLISYKNGKAEVVFAAESAPLSYSVYDVRPSGSNNSSILKTGENWIENSVYKVTLDKRGDIASIVDKRGNKELVAKGKAIRLALFTENMSTSWPAWEIQKKTVDQLPEAIGDDVKIGVTEKGSARVSITAERSYKGSKFVQTISLTNGGADERIDVRTDIDWMQTNALFKVEFPLSISNPYATYDLGIGNVKRANNTLTAYEVYAQQWADLSEKDNSYGVSIINNCKYGWDKPNDNTLRLTLLHTPGTTDRYTYQNKQDFGHHTVTYSIVGHKSDFVNAGTVRMAAAQNNPLYAFNASKHNGALGKVFSMLKVSSAQIDVKAFKKAENQNEYVVRVYETAGKGAENVEIEFASPIVSASELNGIEEVMGKTEFNGNKLIVNTTAFKPKTYSVKLADCKNPLTPAVNQIVKLKFNAEGYTNDAFRDIADFDGKGNSYSFDLLPEKIVNEGVEFRFGKIGRKNILRCSGDTIILPENSKYKTLYLLASSADGDINATFTVDGNPIQRLVPYYSGFFGQWGWQGKGYIKDATIGYVGAHRHNKAFGNEPYVFTYMYKIAIPVNGHNKMVVLPKDQKIAVFAATLSEEESDTFGVACEYRTIPQ
jgi:alpha-mannosidase